MRKAKRRHKPPIKDHQALGQLLGLLGTSGIASSIGELAEEARSGSLQVTPETQAALMSACSDISAMKASLLAALGLKPDRDSI